MSQNPLNLVDQALIDRLSTITPDNGYFTDIGTRIHTKWVGALLDVEGLAYPCITIQPDECPPAIAGAGAWLFHLGRKVIGLVSPDHPDGCLEQLNDIAADLARCLHVQDGMPNPWGRSGPRRVVLKSISQFQPDREVPVGTVSIPVQLHVVLPGE
ncbi:hypothetical protein FQZ97_742260 [compost metagenome]